MVNQLKQMAKTNTRVLIIQNKITNYNLPIYNLIGNNNNIDLTIAHFEKKSILKNNFKTISLTNYHIGSFVFSNENIFQLCQNFDVVISLADLHWIPLMMLSKKINRKFKLIYWTIGVSASYSNKFDENTRWDFLRYFFLRDADAILFYSSYPIKKYIKKNFAKKMLFVAPNTVKINNKNNVVEPSLKNNLLFIGTLYKEKGIFELLTAYKNAFFNNADIPILNVIGDGKEMSKIIQWINKNELNNKIYLRGAIYDSATLEYYFKNAIACISPSQAGLSVLLSMGYGVPFITNFNSITGGERLNIKNNQTGISYKKHSDLMKIILDICVDKIKYLNMGIKAKKFYNEHRTANHMVSGFINAINYVTK